AEMEVDRERVGTMVLVGAGNNLDCKKWKDLRTEEEEDEYIEEVAEMSTELIKKFTQKGMNVVFVCPPVRISSTRDAELKYEREMDNRTKGMKDLVMVWTSTYMETDANHKDYRDSDEGWKDTIKKWLQSDGKHLRPGKLTSLIEHGLGKLKLSLHIRNENTSQTDI
ncbi:MAG: hypothetical protein QGI80_02615, partial [archaeon]|nr:hypothetical protein [archaeon]